MRTASTPLLQNIPASCACTLPFFNISKLVLRKEVLGWIHTGTSTSMHICHGIITSILCSKTFWFVGMSSFTALRHILGHFERSQLAYPHCSWANKKKNNKVPLSVMKTFTRKKMSHTTQFRLIKPHQRSSNDPATKARANMLQFCEFQIGSRFKD